MMSSRSQQSLKCIERVSSITLAASVCQKKGLTRPGQLP